MAGGAASSVPPMGITPGMAGWAVSAGGAMTPPADGAIVSSDTGSPSTLPQLIPSSPAPIPGAVGKAGASGIGPLITSPPAIWGCIPGVKPAGAASASLVAPTPASVTAAGSSAPHSLQYASPGTVAAPQLG